MLNNFNKPNEHCSRITSAIAFSLLVLIFSFIPNTYSSASDKVDFPGKVILPHSSGPGDGHYVLYPQNSESVRDTINLLRGSKSERSALSKMGGGVMKGEHDNITKAVIDLKYLSNVQGDKASQKVIAEAGVTIDKLFKKLIETELVLPLSDNSLMNITLSLLDEAENENPSSLMYKSSSLMYKSMGSLSSYVHKIKAVQLTDGRDVEFTGESAIEDYKKSEAIITEITFQAQPVENLHVLNVFLPYKNKKRFCEIVESLSRSDLFNPDSNLFNPKLDFMLDTFRGPFEIPIMRINAVLYSSEKNKEGKLESLWDCIKNIFDQEQSSLETYVYHKMEALRVITDTQAVFQASPDLVTHSEWFHEEFTLKEGLEDYATEVDEKVFNVREEVQEKQFMSARLRINPSGALHARGCNYTLGFKKEPLKESRYISSPIAIGSQASHDLRRLIESAKPIISEFSGSIYQESDGQDYQDRIIQYATSSFDSASMSPFMVAYPKTVKDIQEALKYAVKHEKKVVARSGGHHYTGKSSGGKDTIVLSMDNFDTLKQAEGRVEVGPGVKLTHLARQFNQWGITIPHGECPFVAIGGHVQTGGYGHLVRSFGLALDYVQSLDIVLANGDFLTANRTDPEGSDGKRIFRAVLGGNPGSFGIIIKYVIEGIKDSDHSNSYGFSLRRSYNGATFKELMKEVQKWTQVIKEKKDGESLRGLDFTMTVRSSTSLCVLPVPALMLVELVYSAPNNETYSNQFNSIIGKAKQGWKTPDYIPIFFSEDKGKRALSKLSDSFVRRFPSTTRKGREFPYPYKKRVNVTIKELSDDFVDRFCEIIDRVVRKESKNIKLIFQMVLGGGEHRDTEKIKDTSLPHRDFVYKFVFDLFYTPGNEEKAEELQSEMQKIVDEHFHNDSHERRVFWGTFGDVNISDPKIRKMYYDSEKDYHTLQKLKKKVDPGDLFHTVLTVEPKDAAEMG